MVLHVNVYAYQRFSPKGVRACVRTHPDNNFECILSRRSACQSYLALGQCIRNMFYVLVLCCTENRKIYQPFHPHSAVQRLNFQGRVARSSTALNLRAVDVLGRNAPSLKTETLTLVTANVTSWSTGTDAGVLSSDAEVVILQEVRLRDESFRAAKAESRKHSYHGQWAPARRIGPCGPASGGLATLVCESRAFRSVIPECPGPNWTGGRWIHTVIGAGGTQVHVINVYGWPFGAPDF